MPGVRGWRHVAEPAGVLRTDRRDRRGCNVTRRTGRDRQAALRTRAQGSRRRVDAVPDSRQRSESAVGFGRRGATRPFQVLVRELSQKEPGSEPAVSRDLGPGSGRARRVSSVVEVRSRRSQSASRTISRSLRARSRRLGARRTHTSRRRTGADEALSRRRLASGRRPGAPA